MTNPLYHKTIEIASPFAKTNLDETAEQPVPQLERDVLAYFATHFSEAYAKSELDQKRLLLRLLIDHVDVAREDKNMIRGVIYYFYPPDDLKNALGGLDNNVPSSRHSSGPPRYRHIVTFPFVTNTKSKRRS